MAISIHTVTALYGSGGGLDDALAEIPQRLMDALAADSGGTNERRPNKGFWNAAACADSKWCKATRAKTLPL